MLALSYLFTMARWFNETNNTSIQYIVCLNHIWFHLADLRLEVIVIIIIDYEQLLFDFRFRV